METSGSKTVKNVVGYDIKRLLVGSGGSLGMLVEATFRTLPLPIAEQTLVLAIDDIESALAIAHDIRVSQLLPSAIELVNDVHWTLAAKPLGLTSGDGQWRMLLSMRGYAADVEFMRGGLASLAENHGGRVADTLDADGAGPVWRNVTEPSRLIGEQFTGLKVVVPAGEMHAPLVRIAGLAAETGTTVSIRASAGSGVIHVIAPGAAEAFGRELVGDPAAPNGFITTDAPAGLAAQMIACPTPDRISAGIKAASDPAGILPDVPC